MSDWDPSIRNVRRDAPVSPNVVGPRKGQRAGSGYVHPKAPLQGLEPVATRTPGRSEVDLRVLGEIRRYSDASERLAVRFLNGYGDSVSLFLFQPPVAYRRPEKGRQSRFLLESRSEKASHR